jgi:choline-sulfatase
MVDVLPTLLDLAGLPRLPAMQGRSYGQALLDGSAIQGRPDVYAVHQPGQIMLRTETHKYLCYVRDDGAMDEVLYDLEADPGEFRNSAQDPDQAGALRALRDRAFARTVLASRSILPRRCLF